MAYDYVLIAVCNDFKGSSKKWGKVRASDKVHAPLPEFAEEFAADIALVGVEGAGQVLGHRVELAPVSLDTQLSEGTEEG